MTPSPERRRSRRLNRRIPCSVRRSPEEDRALKGFLEDVGSGGARLAFSGPARAGDSLYLDFAVREHQFDALPAAVVWAKEEGAGWRCGLQIAPERAGELAAALLGSASQSVLMVEDDLASRRAVENQLVSAGYLVTSAGGIAEGARAFEERAFDLVLLDMTLPDGDGHELLEKIRSHSSRRTTPVVILTADARMESKLSGLAFGADQYLTKPIDLEELLFSVAALLRRSRYDSEQQGGLVFERGRIDPKRHAVELGGKEFSSLSRKEFDLLYHLIAARPRVLSKRYIISRLWHTVTSDNTVEVHINRLREKLGAVGASRIVTVSGKGYKFV